jgi:hypothetical protein
MGELFWVGHFFECGHSLEYLWNLSPTKKELIKEYMFYKFELMNRKTGGD